MPIGVVPYASGQAPGSSSRWAATTLCGVCSPPTGTSPEVSHLLDPCAPVLYRLLREMAVQSGARVGDVQLCGLLALIDGVIPLPLGLGYRIFSVEPTLILALAASVRRADTLASTALADTVCSAPDADSVRRHLVRSTSFEGRTAVGRAHVGVHDGLSVAGNGRGR